MQVRNTVNPIWHVVNLLQEMAKKITEEGEQEAAMYKKIEVLLPNHQPGTEDECGGGKRQAWSRRPRSRRKKVSWLS